MSQPSISRVITRTITALSHCCVVTHHFIFTGCLHLAGSQKGIHKHSGFLQCCWCNEGTHNCNIVPSENKDIFVNRKRYHSINAEIVFRVDYMILDIVATQPGLTHDARTLSGNNLLLLFEMPANYLLLGDSGYP